MKAHIHINTISQDSQIYIHTQSYTHRYIDTYAHTQTDSIMNMKKRAQGHIDKNNDKPVILFLSTLRRFISMQ